MAINHIGLQTLYKREVWRFMKVWNQTITAPVVTTLLFLAILSLAMGGHERRIGDISFEMFVVPGLIMMAVVQNAFANTSSSLMIQKFQGVIIDMLMPPLASFEVIMGMMLGGVTRGLMVGVSVSLALYVFVPFEVQHWGFAFVYLVLASAMLALLGLLTGIWSQTFDQMSAITNYIITPLSFLSGTFYSIHDLPPVWQQVSHANPFFYMIDGFRYALTGHADGDIATGIMVLLAVNVTLWVVIRNLWQRGWRLKT